MLTITIIQVVLAAFTMAQPLSEAPKCNLTKEDVPVNSTTTGRKIIPIVGSFAVASSAVGVFLLTDHLLNRETNTTTTIVPPLSSATTTTEPSISAAVHSIAEEITPHEAPLAAAPPSEQSATPIVPSAPSVLEEDIKKFSKYMGIMGDITKRIKSDRDFIIDNIVQGPLCNSLKIVDDEIKNDKIYFFERVLPKNPWCLQHAAPALQDDLDIVLQAARLKPTAYAHASKRLRSDRKIIQEIIEKEPELAEIIGVTTDVIKSDFLLAKDLVKINGRALCYFSAHLRDHMELVVPAVQQNHYALRRGCVSDRIRDNQDFFVDQLNDQVGASLNILEWLKREWLKDRQFASRLIQKHAYALKYMHKEVRDDEEFAKGILVASPGSCHAYQYFSERLRNKEEIYNLVKDKHVIFESYIGEELRQVFAQRKREAEEEEENRKRKAAQAEEMNAIVKKQLKEQEDRKRKKKQQKKEDYRRWWEDLAEGWAEGFASAASDLLDGK